MGKRLILLGFLGLFLFSSFAFAGINDGLVAYYPFSGDASDASGNGHDGTVYGATLTTDKNGNNNSAYNFDGVDDYIDLTITPYPSSTVSFWVFLNSVGVQYFLELGALSAKIRNRVAIDASGYLGHAYNDDAGNWYPVTSSYQLQPNQWYFITSIIESGNQKLYLNGNLLLSNTYSGTPSLDVYDSYIGKNYGTNEYVTDGIIDEVRIYNRSLTDQEVYNLYVLYAFKIKFTNDLYYCSVNSDDSVTCAINLTDYQNIDNATLILNNSNCQNLQVSIEGTEIYSNSSLADEVKEIDITNALIPGKVNYFTFTADSWGQVNLTDLYIIPTSDNTAPDILSMSASDSVIKGGNTQTISITSNDSERHVLELFCSNSTTEPDSTNTICESGTLTADPTTNYDFTCSFTTPQDTANHTVYCRVYDSMNYSTTWNLTYQTDSIPPNISLYSVASDTSAPYWDFVNDSQTIITVVGEVGMDCRWSSSDLNYSEMSNTCSVLGDTANCNLGDVAQVFSTTYYISCADLYGNANSLSDNLDVTFGIDYTNPVTYDSYDGAVHEPPYNVTIHEYDNVDPNVTTWYCDLNNTCTPETQIDDGYTITFNQTGIWYLRYYSQDSAGNSQDTVTTTILIDNLPRISNITLEVYDLLRGEGHYYIEYFVSDSDGDITYCKLNTPESLITLNYNSSAGLCYGNFTVDQYREATFTPRVYDNFTFTTNGTVQGINLTFSNLTASNTTSTLSYQYFNFNYQIKDLGNLTAQKPLINWSMTTEDEIRTLDFTSTDTITIQRDVAYSLIDVDSWQILGDVFTAGEAYNIYRTFTYNNSFLFDLPEVEMAIPLLYYNASELIEQQSGLFWPDLNSSYNGSHLLFTLPSISANSTENFRYSYDAYLIGYSGDSSADYTITGEYKEWTLDRVYSVFFNLTGKTITQTFNVSQTLSEWIGKTGTWGSSLTYLGSDYTHTTTDNTDTVELSFAYGGTGNYTYQLYYYTPYTPPTTSSGGGGGGGYLTVYSTDNSTLDKLEDIESQINSEFKGYIQFLPVNHHTIKIQWLPAKTFKKQVLIEAQEGSVNATIVFSSNLKQYFKGKICDLVTQECSDNAIMKKGERKYVVIEGNLSDEQFMSSFMKRGEIKGYMRVMNGKRPGPHQYEITIKKSKTFNFTLDIANKMFPKDKTNIGINKSHKKVAYVGLYILLPASILIVGFYILRLFGIGMLPIPIPF